MSIDLVLSQYPILRAPWNVRPLGGAGGFSGAGIWQVSCSQRQHCLRRWPAEHPDESRLRFIHAALLHVGRQGVRLIPLPFPTRHGERFVKHEGRLWELTPWLPGKADFHARPSQARLAAAMKALAAFHRASESFPLPSVRLAPSPGLAERRRLLDLLVEGEAARIAAALARNDADPAITILARRAIPLFWNTSLRIKNELSSVENRQVPMQPCIRDIWRENVLFQDDEVSGLVDFGALRVETPAGDVARLLGSLALDDGALWRLGLEAYQASTPLTDESLRLVGIFDRSGVVLSTMNWLRWIFLEQREFDDMQRVAARLNELNRRLERLAEDRWIEP